MRTPELEAISVFSKDVFLSLTINQISKEIEKSYGFTNKYMREFLDEGILSKKIVGSAILCSLNFSNEKTLGLLMLSSIEEKIAFIKKAEKKTLDTLEVLRKTPTLKTLFATDKGFGIICEDKKQAQSFLDQDPKKVQSLQIMLLDQNEFKLSFKNFNMKKSIIIEGYEQFWRMIAEMMR